VADSPTSSIDELERQATSAYLSGTDEETEALWIRAHNECLQNEDLPRAARCISWLVLDLFNRREWARGNGWLERGLHLLEPVGDSAALGLLLVLASRNHLRLGEVDAAAGAATRAGEIARALNDPDLNVFSRMALAVVHARRGQPTKAASLFDEIMVSVTVDRVSPIAVGVVYCAVIEACRVLFDVSRAREWTAALDRWCSTQPQIVAFRGKCLVHRCEILRLSGDWSQALVEAERACAWSDAHENSFRYPAGAAFYELAEIHRLRGEVDEAHAAYRRASEHGHAPEPGLTLLQFDQGKRDVAAASIRRLLGERQGSVAAEVLLAAVDILTSVDDVPTARIAAEELAGIKEQLPSLAVRAMAAHAMGTVYLGEGELPAALQSLREAWMLWQEVEVPYQAARVRVLLGQACQRSGDRIAAEFEYDGARQFFTRVSAMPDVARVDALQAARTTDSHTLSPRELEVIELVAKGKTNREIARQLSISERTVDRHVSNILLKLNLPSRSAATAYAYEHDLIGRTG
jgi:DNA-binding CsgD family transcriptional regulator/tetratricopeptide (TPR) repeat protein